MKKLHVVQGTSGEYSDRREWIVCAYEDKAKAEAHAEAAKRWYQENDCHRLRHGKDFSNPFDPGMQLDYTGTDWTVYEIPLLNRLPTIKRPLAA